MNRSRIEYRIKKATQIEIYSHLLGCDNNFIPPLSTTLSIQDYASKIYEKTVTFEAWSEDILVGLIAAYFNDPINIMGYITNVSILKNYRLLGIAGELMKTSIEYARQHGFDEISLEVNCVNFSAIQLYEKYGFNGIGIKGDLLQMKISRLNERANTMS